MEAWTAWKTPWTKIFPVSDLLSDYDPSRGPLVVDVGGNTGIDISHVFDFSPSPLPAGSLVLQDLPEIISVAEAQIKGTPKEGVIVPMSHDFFTPQPVKDARAYFMHAVLHDWPDDKATLLLQNTREAMKKGYSKLFVYDIVLPERGTSISQSTMDVAMMALLSASERTKEQWERLLTGAGFVIKNFWKDPQEYEGLIECEVA